MMTLSVTVDAFVLLVTFYRPVSRMSSGFYLNPCVYIHGLFAVLRSCCRKPFFVI